MKSGNRIFKFFCNLFTKLALSGFDGKSSLQIVLVSIKSYHITPHSGACTYIRNSTFLSDQVVSYICAWTKLFGIKCMHIYTKHLYVILTSNFEILKNKIDTQALYDNSKRCPTQYDYIKTISFIFKTN